MSNSRVHELGYTSVSVQTRFFVKECDPQDVEMGAVVYENDVPLLRTFHLPGWEAGDHDDLAEHIVVELRAAWEMSLLERRQLMGVEGNG